MGEVNVKVAKPVDETIKYEVREATTGDKKAYKLIESDAYQIALFPTSGKADPKKGSNLYANARVTLKNVGITFQMVIKKLTSNSELIAGQPGRLSGHRAVVTEWDGEKSFERMSIPNSTHKEIMALISDACK